MSRNDKRTSQPDRGTPEGREPATPAQPVPALALEKIVLRDVPGSPKPVSRQFPGPRSADAALRVAVERRAYAELIAHAKESLEVEVCGVLAGQVCEDAEGVFVHVEAAIRGSAAAQASTHVTFTQETWNIIHKTLEQNYPKLKIVGWYHTHPGFGVEFSDMDLFIQENFFSGPAQIALVTDPLGGATAICVNTPQGPRYLPRFWVDGREQPGRVPTRPGSATGASSSVGPGGNSEAAIDRLEGRINQLARMIDDQQASFHRFLLFCGFVFCLGVIATAGYFIYHTYASKYEPPRLNSYVPVPVQIGDKTALIGIGVVDWKVPDDLNAMMVQMELLKKIAAEKEAAEAAKEATNRPSGTATNPPAAETPKAKSPAKTN